MLINSLSIIIAEQEIQNLVEQAEQLGEVEPEAGDEGAATSASGSASADEAGKSHCMDNSTQNTCTVPSRKRAHYGMSAHPPLLAQFPAKV